MSQLVQSQQAVPAPALASVDGSTAELPQDPQVAAAVAVRAKLERLLAAPVSFADDDSSISPEVRKTLEAVDLPCHQYLDELWTVLAGDRLIVPVTTHTLPGRFKGSLAQSAGLPYGPSGDDATQVSARKVHAADACQDAATLTVDLPGGHIALPVFANAEAMDQWRSDTHLVSVSPQRAVQAACLSTDQLWVPDPGNRDLRLSCPVVVVPAGGEEWVPLWHDEPVQVEVHAQLQEVGDVAGAAFGPSESAKLRVLIRIDATGGRAVVARSLRGYQHAMVNPAWGDLIDTMELRPLPT